MRKASDIPAQNRRFLHLSLFWLPLLVLGVSLVSTYFFWRLVDRGNHRRAKDRFLVQTDDIANQFINRMHDHEQVLLGGNALFHVKGDDVTRGDWHRYVSALRLGENHPGILGVGYAVWLPAARKAANIRELRAEGFPEYLIRPGGERPAYTPIIWLEPFNWRNQRAFGFDMYAEPMRREAMARARDTGRTTVAAKIILVQETEQDQQAGMLMYVPSYRQAMPTDTPAQRRAALRGFVYSPIRMNDFVKCTLSRLPTNIDFEIYAGGAPSADNCIFSSHVVENHSSHEGYRPIFSTAKVIEAYGLPWHFTFHTLPAFDKEHDHEASLSTLPAGILASFLLSALAFYQARSRRQTLTIADQMAQQLAARQKLALHVEQTPLAVIEWDERFRVTAWNRAAEIIFGHAAEDALGAHASFLLPASERERVALEMRELLRKTGAGRGSSRNLTRDGREITCDWYNTTLVDEHGAIIGVASLAQDVTERMEAETRVSEAMERLKLATEAADIGIWSWNFSDDTIEWDERLGAWYEIPAATRQTGLYYDFWRSRVHPDDIDGAEASLMAARSLGTPWEYQFRIVLSNGNIRHIRAAAVIDRDQNDKPGRMIGVNLDVTRQRELEESLLAAKQAAEVAQLAAEDASRAKSEFLANMSHEIRTPMTVFMSAVEQLQLIDTDPEHRQLLNLADQASRRLHDLVNEILDFSKIEARRLEIMECWFNLRNCLQETMTLMTAKTREKGLRLELAISPAVPESLLGDQLRLGQVLLNLIGNAVKFTDAGEVRLAVQLHDGSLEFSVSDTGIGIPADKLEHIFETFSQVDSSATRRFGGTGLGLAISKGLVELMGGRINVRSQLGKGSVFIFTLPVNNFGDAETDRKVEDDSQSLPMATPEARILLVEDNPMVQAVVLMVLARRPWQTTTAETGREAVRTWQAGHFDLIIMDLQMPDMDGLEATREIRRMEADREQRVSIIGMTAHANQAVRAKCLKAGMNEVLIKPFETASLYAAIERCLAG